MENLSQITARKIMLEDNAPFADTHCHLDLFADPRRTFDKAREAGVGMAITAGGSSESNMKILDIVGEGIYGVVGISPESTLMDSAGVEDLPEIVRMKRHIIGIGEIGLDAVMAGRSPLDVQEKAFRRQLDIASSMELPVVVHSRRMIKMTMKVLKESSITNAVFHYFEGNEEDAKTIEREGWLVSIPPIESGRLVRTIKALDIDSIVAETDSPVVGKYPSDVIGVIEKIAALKGISAIEAGEKMTKTLKEYFYV